MIRVISQNLHQQYQDLITKKYLGVGLTAEEETMLAHVEAMLDEEEAPAYEALKGRLRNTLDRLQNSRGQQV